MANLIVADNDVFAAMVHGRPRESNRRFLGEHLGQASQAIGDATRRFMDRAKQAYDSFDLDAVNRSVRAIKGRLESRWQTDDIRVLGRTISELQQAAPRQTRWLAANPTIRRLAHKGRANGWSDTYVDLEPGCWGENHTDWKKVHSGLPVTDEEGNTSFTTYLDATLDGEDELALDEVNSILQSWDFTDYYVKLGGDDPSSSSNGSL